MRNAFSLIPLAFFLIISFSARSVNAQELSLEKVWEIIRRESKAQEASRLEYEAAKEAKNRASLHWLPRLYVDAKSYQTNDPGLSFFGLLSERSVTQADFAPDQINHPEANIYTRGAIGMDLPLYEGGMKVSQEKMQDHIMLAKQQEFSSTKIAQYSEVAKIYGSLLALEDQKSRLVNLQASLERLLKNYRIGSKSNPVGYSGLLGLKTLSNRIAGLISENSSKAQGSRIALSEMGLKRSNWKPIRSELISFSDRYLSSKSAGESPAVMASRENALAAKNGANMEKARYLPRVGAFAEQYISHGNRATDNGYSAGLYLQWNIFNPSDYGTAKEAHLRANAAENHAAALAEKETAESKGLAEAVKAIRENLELMNESQKFLQEQTQVAEGLFKNGSITALQLVEALSRRADLIVSHTDSQLIYLKHESERITKQNFPLPFSTQEFPQ